MSLTPRWLLPAILAAFFLAAATYSVTLPILEGPDESEHFQYVAYLVTQHALPTADLPTVQPDGNNEGKQPPLYYILAAPLVAGIDLSAMERIRINPHAGWVGTNDAHFSVLHVLDEGWPYHGIFLAAHLVRLLSALLGTVTVALTYGCATVATGSRRLGIVAALLVACLPNFLFASATINNDALADTMGAALLYLALRALHGSGRLLPLAYGIIGGLALLTKLSLVLPIALGFVAILSNLPASRRRAVSFAATPLLPAVGYWMWRVATGERELIGRPTGGLTELTGRIGTLDWTVVVQFAEHVVTTFFAYFGWASTALPGWYYAVCCLVVVLGLAGWRLAKGPSVRKDLGLSTVLLLWGLPLAFLCAMLVAAVAVTDSSGGTYGTSRLLYPALPAIAILVAYGWGRWSTMLPAIRRLAGPALALDAGAALAIPLIILRPFSPVPWPVSDRPGPSATPVADAEFTNYTALVGVKLPPGDITAGTGVYVTLYWRVTHPLPVGEWLFIHVEDRQGVRVAAFDGQPSSATLPLSYWREGDVVTETEVLTFHQDAPPGQYQLHIGWYNPNTGVRLPAGEGAAEVLAGTVMVRKSNA